MTIKAKTRTIVLECAVLLQLTLTSCASIDTSGADIETIRASAIIQTNKLPIVYSPDYDISFAGIEQLHPFDTKKYSRVFKRLQDTGILSHNNYFTPKRPDRSVLLRHHSETYLNALQNSKSIAQFSEIHPIKWLPDSLAYNQIMEPMKIASAGSILAGELALRRGWAINIGGGYHHASKGQYGGFCSLADISLSI